MLALTKLGIIYWKNGFKTLYSTRTSDICCCLMIKRRFQSRSLPNFFVSSWCQHPLLYIFRLAFIPVLCLFLTLILRYRRGTCWNWIRLTNCWLILFAEPTYRSFPVCGIYLLPLYIFLLILSSIKSTKTIFEVHSGHHRY